MKIQSSEMNKSQLILICFLFAAISSSPVKAQQKISLGLHADPVISWFSSDITTVKNNGATAGFNFGLIFNKYFTPNYAFSTGISLLNAGGRLVSSDTTIMEFNNFTKKVFPGKAVTYKIQYLVIPLGLKLQTNQIGYLTFFSDIGVDPKIVVGGKADIPSLNLSNQKATNELNMFNFSYHVTVGIEYSLGGTTALVAGLGFDNNFLDITKDIGKQPKDKISQKILSFRLGINF
jgi:hypothetical protein